MRDPNRLTGIYEHIKKVHKDVYPDMHICSVFKDMLDWAGFNDINLFYMEDDKVTDTVDRYASERGATRGWYNLDPERLDALYDYLCTMHRTYFPDWRVFQLVSNFADDYGKACFGSISDDDQLYEEFEKYVKKVIPWKKD